MAPNIKKLLLYFKELSINSYIYHTYNHSKINDKIVYLESRDGNDFTGNILRIAQELSTGEYGNYKIYVFAKKEVVPKIKKLEKTYNLKIHKIVTKEALATRILEKAKFIIHDSGIRPKFIKRPGQIVLNTWHGTPLKYMGKDNVSEEHRVANVQHPFLSADYLLYPNDFMKEKMMKAYMIEKIYPGKILLEGYPRNSVFFDEERKEELKKELNLQDKEIFVYMPTFKGILTDRKDEEQKYEIEEYLEELDEKLNDKQLALVKLHVYNRSKLNFDQYKHVKPFIEDYETYDVLNMADVLITDYSSVFFDFANTRRKIVLFNYDEEEYMKYRGTYFPLSDLPFPKVQTIDDLVKELNSPKEYDDSEFLEKFCTYDRPDAAKYICKHVFKGEKVCKEEVVENDKPNVLIFGGGLLNNGITSSLISVLSNIDRENNNIFISYRTWDKYIAKNHEEVFERIPEGVQLLPLRTKINPTLTEKIKLYRFAHNKNYTGLSKSLEKLFKRELSKEYSRINFHSMINFDGYGIDEQLLLANADVKNSCWVHNDMVQEIETRDIQNINVLKYIYNKYDIVSVVSPDLIKPTSQISGRKDNIRIVHNINNYEKILENGNKDLELNKNTHIYTNNLYGIKGVLEKPGKKIITIGRYSPEKSHDRLLNAFDKFADDYPDTQIIIIGGHGVLYNKTEELVGTLKHWKNVTLIKWIANPMPILKECDLFVLSSFYEGWPMVLMEADTFNIPVMATDITGTQWMKDYNGHVVENSEEGILQGLYDFAEGKVEPLGIDYEEYNKNAVEEFNSVM
ncbi:CDP-glycerol glycerophosphotransferase family protein [uncultured Methanobrevibacter sp.]|uniref:CDP-glycerol glycerophosphotransferase family protein n=1 Tax=uncultured Methanobrevibacter sp. TaxID=253161 RepID=UPI0025EE4A8F|nr:CDP-glycerol glycerophosphotransferase family protein [uncultured Methanobrevibacter sp.]